MISHGCSKRTRTLSPVGAVGDDVPRLLTTITLDRSASPTARKSMHGAAVSNWPIFWHMGAQILARRHYRADVLCSRPCQDLEHPLLVCIDKHIDGKIDFVDV